MSIHKLSAGSGYAYLTRQVAALDATATGHVGLASYYTERGESPGVWVGAGLVGIDGLEAGDAVTGEQMRALFGAGMHPLATQRLEQLRDTDLTEALGGYSAGGAVQSRRQRTCPVSGRGCEADRRVQRAGRVAGGLAGFAYRAGQDTDRTELFAIEHGRPPADAREVAGTIAKHQIAARGTPVMIA